MLEYVCQSLLRHVLLDVDGGGDEFGVVDFAVLLHIHLLHEFVKLILGQLKLAFFESLSHFVGGDEASSVCINFQEKLLQRLNILLFEHIHQDIERRQPHLGFSFVFEQMANHTLVELHIIELDILVLCDILEPGVLNRSLCRDSVFRALFEHLQDQVLGLKGDVFPLGAHEDEGRVYYFILEVADLEWVVAGQHHVEDDAEGPDVDGEGVGVPLEDFRCHEMFSSHIGPQAEIDVDNVFAESEIENDWIVLIVYHYVFGLEIAVDDSG